MFEWLETELKLIRTSGFHAVDGPAHAELSNAINKSDLLLPSSYREFVMRFGNAKLYRRASNKSYRVGVFAGPRAANSNAKGKRFQIGSHDGARVYITNFHHGYHIFESEVDREEQVAETFEEWLEESCAQARSEFSDKQWSEIVDGPRPFSAEEAQIIEARERFHWAVLGVDLEGSHIFEVKNLSTKTLPVLTIGIRSKDGNLNGAVRLRVKSIAPGQTALLNVGCYRGLVQPEEMEAFPLPDPKPEDREYYPELLAANDLLL